MALVNSPLNRAVGQAIRRLREKQALSIENCAKQLDVSEPYLRAIEAGSAALPAYSVHGLVWGFGASFASAAGLLALITALDKRQPGRSSDMTQIKGMVAKIVAAERDRGRKGDPQLANPFLKLLSNTGEAADVYAATASDPNAQIQYKTLIEDIERIVDDLLKAGKRDLLPPITKKSELRLKPILGSYEISPVFEDLVDAFAARLSLFPPYITSASFEKWERKNSPRIANVSAYLTDPEAFLKIAAEYDWAFLWNQNKPRVTLLTSSKYANTAKRIEDALRKAIRGIQPRSIKNKGELRIYLRPVSGPQLNDKCNHGLLFDFISHNMPSPKETSAKRKVALARLQYRAFANVWLFELRPDVFDPDDERLHRIGFLDTFESDDVESAFAVVMSREHIDYWTKLFDEVKNIQQ